jgi:signal transduction histidine kinase
MIASLRPRSLRVRLTASFFVLGGLLVVVASIGVSILLRRAVWRPLDAALEEESVGLIFILHANNPEPGHEDWPRDDGIDDLPAAVAQIGSERDLGPGKFVAVVDQRGASLASHGKPPAGFTLVPPQADDRGGAEFFAAGDYVYRVVRHPIPEGGWISIGVRADRQLKSLARARLGLGFGATVFLVVLGALAWRITTRATSEIDGMNAELTALAADSLHRRLAQRDTIEVDRLAAALNRLLARLDQAVSHLRRFTADAAHELRTPLAALRAHIEGALAAEPSVDAYRDGLVDALEQTERLSLLAEDLLTLSAVETAESVPDEEVDLSSLAREVGEFLQPVAEEQNRTLAISTEPSTLVRGSSKLLKRVFVNVLDNAFRHTRNGGRVDVEVTRQGPSMRVCVRDEGPGFDASEKDLLFRRFGRGKSERAGSGLGLAICQEIVRKHHGTIEITSASGKGTTVLIELPAVPLSAAG